MSKDDSNNEERKVTNIWIAFGLAFLLVVVLYFIFVLTNAENFSEVTAEGFSGFGAFVGGVGGTLFSAIAAGLVYMAYSTQKKELANSATALNETQRNQKLQSNLSALNPVMKKVETDFTRKLISWFEGTEEASQAAAEVASGECFHAQYHPMMPTELTSLSDLQPLNPDNHGGFQSDLAELMGGALASTNYNGAHKLRFFLIKFIIQTTSAMQVVKNMYDNESPAHFYISAALLLEEVNQTLTCIFNEIAGYEEIPSHHAWCRNFLQASSDLDEVLNQIHSEN